MLLSLILYKGQAQTLTGFRIGNNIAVAGDEGEGPYFGFQSAWYIHVETYKPLSYCIEFKISSLGYTVNDKQVEKLYRTSVPILLSYKYKYHRPELFIGIEPLWNMAEDRRESFINLPDKYKLSKKSSYNSDTYVRDPFGIDLVTGIKFHTGKTNLFLFANYGVFDQFAILSLSIGLNRR